VARAAQGVALTRAGVAAAGVAALLGAALCVGSRASRPAPDLERWRVAIEDAARSTRAWALDPHLLAALVAAESGGDPGAASRAGARGLCQLMPATAREVADALGVAGFEPDRLFEPALNLRLGAEYLARMLAASGGAEDLALAAYNAGPGNLARWRARAPGATSDEVLAREAFPETRAYVRRVLRWREDYRSRWER
jgi:soluble lytic murein transglycosylase